MPGVPAVLNFSKAGFMGVLVLVPRLYNTVRPHSSLGYRPPALEAVLPATMRAAQDTRVSHIPTPPTATAAKLRLRRYTNFLLECKKSVRSNLRCGYGTCRSVLLCSRTTRPIAVLVVSNVESTSPTR